MTKFNKTKKASMFKNKVPKVLGKGLETIGTTAKNIAVNTAPVVEKGVSTVYGTLASGFNLGKNVAKNIIKNKTKKHSRRTRRRSHHRKHRA